MTRILRSEDVVNATFTQTQFREGYDESEVDDLLDEAAAALRHHESGPPAGAAPLSSGRVTDVRFSPTRLRRGYDQVEIDAFLDDLVHALRHHESEQGSALPTGRSTPPAPPARPAPPALPEPPTHGSRGAGDLPPGVQRHETLGARVLRVLRGDQG